MRVRRDWPTLRETKTEGETGRQRQSETDRDKVTQTQRDRKTDRQTKTTRVRDRQTDRRCLTDCRNTYMQTASMREC